MKKIKRHLTKTDYELLEFFELARKNLEIAAKVAQLAKHPKEKRNNRERLEEELGDLICMIGLLVENKIVDETKLKTAAEMKLKKLRIWSNIFKEAA